MGKELQHPHQGGGEGWGQLGPGPSPNPSRLRIDFFSAGSSWCSWDVVRAGVATYPLAQDGEAQPPSEIVHGVFQPIEHKVLLPKFTDGK